MIQWDATSLITCAKFQVDGRLVRYFARLQMRLYVDSGSAGQWFLHKHVRLRRPMCGRSADLPGARPSGSGLRPTAGAKPQNFSRAPSGKSETCRTSSGRAALLSGDTSIRLCSAGGWAMPTDLLDNVNFPCSLSGPSVELS